MTRTTSIALTASEPRNEARSGHWRQQCTAHAQGPPSSSPRLDASAPNRTADSDNRIIDALPATARSRLLGLCQKTELKVGETLSEAGQPVRYVYFPVAGLVSLQISSDQKLGFEVAMVGIEGMLGIELSMGVQIAPLSAVVRSPGRVWRIGAKAFCHELALGTELRRSLSRYAYVSMVQLARSSACPHFHPIGPRLASWLLRSMDHADAGEMAITQESIAHLLGIRRESVTEEAIRMQAAGHIRNSRGRITLLNREGLEEAACTCYANYPPLPSKPEERNKRCPS